MCRPYYNRFDPGLLGRGWLVANRVLAKSGGDFEVHNVLVFSVYRTLDGGLARDC